MQVQDVKTTLLRKVPEISLLFWIVKLLTTAFGEAASDYLVAKISPYEAVLLGAIAFIVALYIQFRAKRYQPWIYWLAVAMVAVFGTMAADAIHVQLGVPYLISTLFFIVVLGIIFKTWHVYEHTLSIHSITNRRREFFYWATVVATFALGTATGDLTAITFHLGYFSSGLLFLGLILIPAIAYIKLGLNEVLSFWLAYVLTRPLGASFADWMGKPISAGGLGFGDLPVSTVLAVIIMLLVIHMTRHKVESLPETE